MTFLQILSENTTVNGSFCSGLSSLSQVKKGLLGAVLHVKGLANTILFYFILFYFYYYYYFDVFN